MNKKIIEVSAAVIQKNQLIFCAQRPNKGETAYKWEFPGGKLEVNETKEEAIIREIKEELYVDIVIDEELGKVEHQYETFYLVLYYFKCHIVSGKIKLKEHLNAKWGKIEELAKLDFAMADRKIIDQLLNQEKK